MGRKFPAGRNRGLWGLECSPTFGSAASSRIPDHASVFLDGKLRPVSLLWEQVEL